MTEQDKQLLLKDLCSRLPYGVILANGIKARSIDVLTKIVSGIGTDKKIEDTKYYLRPMSNMTEEEHKEIRNKFGDCNAVEPGVGSSPWYNHPERDLKNVQFYLRRVPDIVDWLNAHHFDYRNLIEKGLALPAPPDMYKID